jgi:peptide/nickel transport system permease protein
VARYILQRTAQSTVVVFAVTVVVFLLLRLTPGDPAQVMLGDMATPEAIANLRRALELDRPLPVQYLAYMKRVLRGDFGLSLRAQRPVVEVVLERVPATLKLSVTASTLALVVGIPVGVLAALKRGSLFESTGFALSLLGQAMPGYWLGLLLINVFSVGLGWLPVSGSDTPAHIVLPAVTLSAFMLGLNVRLARSSMMEVMGQDYIRTARAKGLSHVAIILRHTLKPILIPVVTVVGLQIGTLLSGAVVTESIFAWPGIGSLAVLAIFQRDYSVVQALVLLSALTFVLLNLLVDVLYVYLDPRIAYK